MTTDIVRFVDKLLEHPPGNPHSVQLEIDTDNDVHALYEVLLMIMTEILKRWYAPPISIRQISEEDCGRLVQYFASFGIRFELDISPLPTVCVIRNKDYLQCSELESMKFQVSADKLYTVRFRYLDQQH